MMLSPISRMFSAISFGVFWRAAPSTSEIMRSRNVEPGAAVMRTRIQSDSTWVPPVTAERSPPDSRMTGADSPVIAASLTDATPSTTSPSEGMVSPGSTSTTSPTLRVVLGTRRKPRVAGPVNSLAWVSVRVLRNESACALPRPSAMASAKFANSTVNQSQMMICSSKPIWPPPVMRSRTRMIVVRIVTISSTNITGFRISVAGLSLTNDEPIAGTRIFGSNNAEAGVPLRVCEVSMSGLRIKKLVRGEGGAGDHREMLDDRTERQRREEGEAADDQDDADDEADEQAAGGREGAGRRRNRFLGRERTCDRHCRDDHPEPADEHRDRAGDVVKQRIGRDASER